ncbi:hypothetical protein BDR04DRAFT_169722 [Suillus decipiens]|nr:hypothetical protein BDR04DRAFT_169722 [Suillus decipiens]
MLSYGSVPLLDAFSRCSSRSLPLTTVIHGSHFNFLEDRKCVPHNTCVIWKHALSDGAMRI